MADPGSPRPRAWRRAAGAAVALLIGGPALAEEPPIGQLTPYLRILGEIRARVEYNNFFKPAQAINDNNEYVFGATRTRLGVALTTSWVDALVQAEHTGLYGLPDDAVAVPGGALGTGALYFAEDPDTNQSDLHLKQAYLTLKPALLHVPGLSLTAGRFEILDGLEYRTGDAKFDFLKTVRISQRLLGPFDFAHATRNFDGGAVTWDHGLVNITATATHPTEGGFNIDAQETITDIDLVYGAVTGKPGSLGPGTEARIFYLFYGDDRSVRVVDNRPLAQLPFLDREALAIHNVGGHVLAAQTLGPGGVDALVWADYQFGDWTNLDHRAWAVGGEIGYQWMRLPWQPWLRAGYFRSSGDDNPTDGTHETFFGVLPTGRMYANFPFYNLMNIEDLFAQLLLSPPVAGMRFRMDFHSLALSDSADLWYAGSGPQREDVSFGYVGRASNGARSLAAVIEAGLSHVVNRHFSWNVYYGHAFGGGVIRRFFRGQDDADYAFADLTAKF